MHWPHCAVEAKAVALFRHAPSRSAADDGNAPWPQQALQFGGRRHASSAALPLGGRLEIHAPISLIASHANLTPTGLAAASQFQRHLNRLPNQGAWLYHTRLSSSGGVPSIRLSDGTTRETWLFGVPGAFFDILGVQAHVGRLGAPAEGQPVAILSHALWRDVYGTNEDIAGELLHIVNGASVPIAGVASPEFVGIVPMPPDAAWVLNPRFDLLLPNQFAAGVGMA